MVNLTDDELLQFYLQRYYSRDEDSSGEKYLVFVYGSLKRGFGNNFNLHRSKFICGTRTKHQRYEMRSYAGYFPVVSKTSYKPKFITGELYEVSRSTLARLDSLESNGSFYTRELVELEHGKLAWMYLVPNDLAQQLDGPGVKVNDRRSTHTWT